MRPNLVLLLAGAAIVELAPLPARAARCPTMVIVLDRSASMLDAGKWTAAVSAIEAFTHSQAPDGAPRQARERFGLMVFPALDPFGCAPGTLLVGSDFFTADAVAASLDQSAPVGGSTPTGESLKAACSLPELKDETRPRYVLLITDGVPNCAPSYPTPGADAATLAFAVDQVKALLAQGVTTFVIGFGKNVEASALDKMAAAGGAARADAEHAYYEAVDEEGLSDVFDEIDRVRYGEGGVRACDDSCYAEGCPQGQRCAADPKPYGSYTMNLGKCEPEPCAGVSCPTGSFCREGLCTRPCPQGCASGEKCVDGACQPDPCYPYGCSQCPPCVEHLVCSSQGACVDDPCIGVACPSDAPFCSQGGCGARPSWLGADGGTDGGGKNVIGKAAGCSCGSAGSLGTVLAAALLLPWWRWRRKGARSGG